MSENEAQRQMWNAPARMASWKEEEPSLAAVAEPLLVAAQVEPGGNVLDIGCGGGLTTLIAAGKAGPRGAALGIDISEAMIELATERAAQSGLPNVTFEVADAQTGVFSQAPFDVAMSRFGVMFFEDPVAAFSNIAHHVRSGGRLAFACWQGAAKNRWFPSDILRKYRPQLPPGESPSPAARPAPGPFAFADREYVRKILEDSGFTSVEFDTHEYEWRVPIRGAEFGGLVLGALDLDAETRAQATKDLIAYEQELVVDGQVLQKRAYFIVTARRP